MLTCSLGVPQWPDAQGQMTAGPSATHPSAGLAGAPHPNQGHVLIYANGGGLVAGSRRHPSPRFPAPVIHQPALKIIHFLFKAIT